MNKPTENAAGRPETRRNITLITLQTFLTLALIGGTLLFIEQRRLQNAVFEAGEVQGQFLFDTISEQTSDAIYFQDIEQLRRDGEILALQSSIRRIAIFNADGRYLYDSNQVRVPTGFLEPGLLELSRRYVGSLNRWHEDRLEFVGAVRFDGRYMGGLYFELDVREQLAHNRLEMTRYLLFGGLLILMASALSFVMATMLGTTRSLRTAESNFRELIEQSPHATSIHNRSGVLTYSNPAFTTLMSGGEATRRTLKPGYNLFKDPALERLQAEIRLGFKNGPVETAPFNYRDGTGEPPLWLTFVIFPLRQEKGPADEIVLICQDVTEAINAADDKAQLASRMLESQKLEGLGTMARGIAHDFNNLLTPILGNADLLTTQVGGDPTSLEQLDNIMRAAQHASDLCGQMLAYGGGNLRKKALVDVSREVNALRQLMESSVSKRTEFTQELAANLPPILVDVSQLRQVILNLLVNASEALEDDSGEITLRTGIASLSESEARHLVPTNDLPAGDFVFIQVEDNGCGMTPEIRKNLFDPFFSTKFTGRGLGMSAVLGIAGNHDGGIDVATEEGKGSVFTVYFPAQVESETGDDDESAAQPPEIPDGSLALLADDEEAVLHVGRSALESMGFEVITDKNGETAVELFDKNVERLSCVILDVVMPRMDGERALKHIRERRAELPVVITTGTPTGDLIDRIRQDRCVTIMRKPWLVSELKQVLSTVVQASDAA